MTSPSTADHDRHLGKDANCSFMVYHCLFQTGNELWYDWCVASLITCFHIFVCQGMMGCQKVYKVDKLLKQSQREVLWSQRQRLATVKKSNWMRCTEKVSVLCVNLSMYSICFDSAGPELIQLWSDLTLQCIIQKCVSQWFYFNYECKWFSYYTINYLKMWHLLGGRFPNTQLYDIILQNKA